jgi:CBS domain containing-hemolysin-like protein
MFQKTNQWLKSLLRKVTRGHVTEEEIQSLIDEGEQEGVINQEEHAMLDAVLDLGDTKVREVLVPRTEMIALEKDSSLESALETIIEAGHSRIPVYDGDIDNIVGILYAKDLLKSWGCTSEEIDLLSKIRKAFFVPESKAVNELLKEFKTKRVHMAIVVDEYGGTSGLITIEDILEEIVGEIQDEYDLEEMVSSRKLDDGSIIFDARYPIDDFEEETGVVLEKGDYDTLGGFVIRFLGHVPVIGEQFTFSTVEFIVEDADARRVSKIRVRNLGNGAP